MSRMILVNITEKWAKRYISKKNINRPLQKVWVEKYSI